MIILMQTFYDVHSWQFPHLGQMVRFRIADLSAVEVAGKKIIRMIIFHLQNNSRVMGQNYISPRFDTAERFREVTSSRAVIINPDNIYFYSENGYGDAFIVQHLA